MNLALLALVILRRGFLNNEKENNSGYNQLPKETRTWRGTWSGASNNLVQEPRDENQENK